ncbi:hypothetical protein [Gracilibacillus oryzae]|nr:hypothetical protein [Gracilibacillus oryzae]
MELIANLENIKMYEDLEFGGFIVIDGKSYRHCMYNVKKDILCVEPTELDEDPDDVDDCSEFTCPYCGYKDQDAFELSDNGTTECSSCGSNLEYERTYTIEYNVRPVKCAPITRV